MNRIRFESISAPDMQALAQELNDRVDQLNRENEGWRLALENGVNVLSTAEGVVALIQLTKGPSKVWRW